MLPQADTKGHRKSRKKKRRVLRQTFASYLSFGIHSTSLVACFFSLYVAVLMCLLPMLQTELIPQNTTGPFQGAHIPHAPGQEKIVEAASALKSQFQRLRRGSGVTDEGLLEETISKFEIYRERKRLKAKQEKKMDAPLVASPSETPGVVVLGMHRSGTSMLSGLLVQGNGYNVGGPLIGAAFDNEKGFFERVDVVLQNDEFMRVQRIWWSAGVREYDAERALKDKESGKLAFEQGEKGLAFLNDPENIPWLQKDPRMCITLRTWLKLLNKQPAVVFTYRHPLEVANSLKKREQNFNLEHGLRLWIIYNMRAVQNSADLCRVLSSNNKLLKDPLTEVQRISDELTTKCGVHEPPRRIKKDVVDRFVDPNLQHNKKKLEIEMRSQDVLETHDGCIVRKYISDQIEGTPQHEREMTLYKQAMKIYCDFESGKAYEAEYQWPTLP